MSRELRRVPLNFNWPLKKVWDGYLMPDELRLPGCPDCRHDGSHSSGYSAEAYAVYATFYPHMIGGPNADKLAWNDKLGQAEVDNLQAQGRLRTLTIVDGERVWDDAPRTAESVNAENRRGARGFGHDAINHGILVRFRCEQLGIPVYCATCDGNGEVGTPEQRAAHDAWTPTDPPTGDGYQLWETTTEGSPASPVFATLNELCDWCADNATTFGSARATADEWRSMLDGGVVTTTLAPGVIAI